MESWGTILSGWAIVLVALAVYAGWLLLRARVVARDLRLGEDDDAGAGGTAAAATETPS